MDEQTVPRSFGRSSRIRRIDGLREDRLGQSQLSAMLCRRAMTGRFWRQKGLLPALSAVMRE